MTAAIEVSVREQAIAAHVEAVRIADERAAQSKAGEIAGRVAGLRKGLRAVLGVDLADTDIRVRADGLPETTAVDGLLLGLYKDQYDYWPRLSVGLTCSREGCRHRDVVIWRNFYDLVALGQLISDEQPHHPGNCTIEYDEEGEPVNVAKEPAIIVSAPPSVEQRLGDLFREIVREEIESRQ